MKMHHVAHTYIVYVLPCLFPYRVRRGPRRNQPRNLRQLVWTLDETPPGHQAMIGDRIRSLRKEQGVSLRALAKRAGASVSYLAKLERGESSPTLDFLGRLAPALGVSQAELCDCERSISRTSPPSESLRRFIDEFSPRFEHLSDPEWVRLLQCMELRGQRPHTVEEWLSIFLVLRSVFGD